MKIEKIFIDMDGVLADFDGWKAEAAKTHPEILTDKEELWKEVSGIDHFYWNLPLMPYALDLMKYLRSLQVPLAILTAIPRRRSVPQATHDKIEWIKAYIDSNLEFHIGPFAQDKQRFSGPGRVLIDDNEKNIAQWNSRGGRGVLYRGFKNMECLLK